MSTKETTRRTRALMVVAAAATALVGMVPAVAVAQNGSGTAARHGGYVCDRLETHRDGAVGSGRCQASHAPHRGNVHGTFTIQSRHGHHRVVCVGRHHRPSGYANTPKWVRGEHCRRA